ncbi:hypothetical protein HK100_000632 [Physocladia obscura]|uniref:Uncharacterized protein n=1 Tax=Physocladia obscura TaxID=109957 RepID=A0AAD5T0W5_9FUNG|nr:hypothetical protein HK100_000632 [Physocladia obscura]
MGRNTLYRIQLVRAISSILSSTHGRLLVIQLPLLPTRQRVEALLAAQEKSVALVRRLVGCANDAVADDSSYTNANANSDNSDELADLAAWWNTCELNYTTQCPIARLLREALRLMNILNAHTTNENMINPPANVNAITDSNSISTLDEFSQAEARRRLACMRIDGTKLFMDFDDSETMVANAVIRPRNWRSVALAARVSAATADADLVVTSSSAPASSSTSSSTRSGNPHKSYREDDITDEDPATQRAISESSAMARRPKQNLATPARTDDAVMDLTGDDPSPSAPTKSKNSPYHGSVAIIEKFQTERKDYEIGEEIKQTQEIRKHMVFKNKISMPEPSPNDNEVAPFEEGIFITYSRFEFNSVYSL